MSEKEDHRQIRDLISTWIEASSRNDLDTLLTLMAEDVVFLRPGQPPMRGREAFAAASRASAGQIHVEGKADIQEIQITGDHAYCWNFLTVTITPVQGGPTKHLAGHILSIFRREPNGRWLLLRDANLLVPA
ncbi:MAG TPA: SgcJ/EcaC family oxidoreductase [Chthoniobacter sp.]|jgi:uncharacterized protein (TIGR02246 family)